MPRLAGTQTLEDRLAERASPADVGTLKDLLLPFLLLCVESRCFEQEVCMFYVWLLPA